MVSSMQKGLCIMYPAPGIVERIGLDWDWIWIDGQHGELDYHDILALVRACDFIQRPAYVRTAGHDPGLIGKILDTGAGGIIVPCVDTPDQARQVVQAAKFPPLGNRSYGGRRPIDLHGRLYSERANTEIRLVVQIESLEALQQVDEIASIPGIDALLPGPDDLLLRRGGNMDNPSSRESLADDLSIIAQACRKHGKIGFMVAPTPKMQSLCQRLGFTMLVCASDAGLLARASNEAAHASAAATSKKEGEQIVY